MTEPTGLTRQMLVDAFERMRDMPMQPHQLGPIHPSDYTAIQADLGTTEPLTERQVIDWAWTRILEASDEPE